MKALGGCVMELDDCAFPLLTKVVQTDKLEVRLEMQLIMVKHVDFSG
jgi:hypothetical protein